MFFYQFGSSRNGRSENQSCKRSHGNPSSKCNLLSRSYFDVKKFVANSLPTQKKLCTTSGWKKIHALENFPAPLPFGISIWVLGTNMKSSYLIKLFFYALDFFFHFIQMTSRLLEKKIKFIYHAVTNVRQSQFTIKRPGLSEFAWGLGWRKFYITWLDKLA